MVWKCRVDDRYVSISLVDDTIDEMKKNGEKFGPRYTVLSKLYENGAHPEVVMQNGQGTLIDKNTGFVIAQDRPGKWAELRPHIGHELYMGDFCGGQLIYVECVECRSLIYDCAWNE